MNVFDIIGPVMIGPSSSHTAGAARIGRIGLALLGERAVEADVLLHGSFARTYRGHGTDKALAAGIMGMEPENPKLRESLELAKEQGIAIVFRTGDLEQAHPNTARLLLTGESGKAVCLQAASTGGGSVLVTEIDGMPVSFTCEYPVLIVRHRDVPGMIAAVADEVGRNGINICNFRLAREEKGGAAVMTLELDGGVEEEAVKRIQAIPEVGSATYLAAI